MSAFDDEFGLFGDENKAEEEERTSTLGARRIASDEAAHDDIEPEDERPRRGPRGDRRDRTGGGTGAPASGEGRPRRREYGGDRGARKTDDPAVAQQRALDLLGFLARKLVSKPDNVLVEEVETDKGPVVELVVEHEDLGKVIGRSGRVAQALRTLVRASAEGRISIDIISFEDEVLEGEAEHAGDLDVADGATTAPTARTTTPRNDANAGRVAGVFGLRGELKVAASRIGDGCARDRYGACARCCPTGRRARCAFARCAGTKGGRWSRSTASTTRTQPKRSSARRSRSIAARWSWRADEYFDDDLVGCALVDANGTALGDGGRPSSTIRRKTCCSSARSARSCRWCAPS